ncbi:MAG: SUF system NifU family Fe-S cluster assembly protein [Actinobacteria bacterium]|nr:SUF system NifU family Fe-S cluster assembly protein [Actinomycetota bacterium]
MSYDDGTDLAELYREVIVEHGRHPRNFGELADANRRIEGQNPLCGDHLEIALRVDDGVIVGIAFTGSGCAISQASASLMTEAVTNTSLADARGLFDRVHAMLTTAGGDGEPVDPAELGKLAALGGVSKFPTRVKCASLAWQALRQVIDDDEPAPAAVTTE